MLTGMREEDWTTVLAVFKATRSPRGDKGRNDRRFLEALHYFVVHNITWRALPVEYGHWNSVWKRFWRLSQTGFFLRIHLGQIRPHGLGPVGIHREWMTAAEI
jgi:transposase